MFLLLSRKVPLGLTNALEFPLGTPLTFAPLLLRQMSVLFCKSSLLCSTLHMVYLQVLTDIGSQSQDGPTHVPPALKNFSISQKQKALDELVLDQWLTHTPDGNIGLGVRSFLDLRSYFRNSDIPSCQVCNEAGVKVVIDTCFAILVDTG
jgi:hypothetical protein